MKTPLKSLDEERSRRMFCYPQGSPKELASRIEELETLGVTHVIVRQSKPGQTAVQGVSVLGKGCQGIVVKAYREKEMCALKIRRIDSSRPTMHKEAHMLKRANRVEVGPQLLGVTKNFLLMECIEGLLLPAWLQSSEKKGKEQICSVIRQALEQAWRLDEAGISHGELSQAPKHIIVDVEGRAHILDFESASVSRQASNVTALCQYLFLRSNVAGLIRKALGGIRQRALIQTLRTYKDERSRENFRRILIECKLLFALSHSRD